MDLISTGMGSMPFIRPRADFLIRTVSSVGAGEHSPLIRFQVTYKEKNLGEFTLHVPGAHNVLNATAAIAVGTALDIPAETIRSALDGFRGVDRRFQLKAKAARPEEGREG